MVKTVGIPKALLYYNFYPMWKTFFEGVGANVIVSQETNKKIVDDGIKSCVDSACLPVKTYLGHVIDLIEKKVDYIFIPRVVSVEPKKYLCSKFLGLPDFVKSSIDNLQNIIDAEINLYNGEKAFKKEAIKIGNIFTYDNKKILQSYYNALNIQKEFEDIMKRGYTATEAFRILETKKINDKVFTNYDIKIGLLGHSYDIMDNYISMGIVDRLKNMGVKIYTIEMLSEDQIYYGISKLSKDMFWKYERDILGAGLFFLENNYVDGVISVAAFGCGPDSLTEDYLERMYKRKKTIPFMQLTIDEHTGEAGILTRIEAFIDLLKYKKRKVVI